MAKKKPQKSSKPQSQAQSQVPSGIQTPQIQTRDQEVEPVKFDELRNVIGINWGSSYSSVAVLNKVRLNESKTTKSEMHSR
jgi:hypothetical protein